MLAHQQLKGIGIYRTFFSSTVATSVAVAAVIFGTLMNPSGRAAAVAGAHHQPDRSCRTPSWALIAVAVITIWQNARPHVHPHVGRACRACPTSSIEAARVDGAGAWSRFWHVTLPMMSPTIFFAVVIGTIFAFQSFGQIDILTQGGPLKKTNVLTYYIYDTLQRQSDPGKAAVLAVALFFLTLDPRARADPAARAAGVV